MIDGVARVGWDEQRSEQSIELVVDRLVLEILLCNAHRRLADGLDQQLGIHPGVEPCFVTWVPDAWTLAALRDRLGDRAKKVRTIYYPGYGISLGERKEIEPVIRSFRHDTQLVSFEEALS